MYISISIIYYISHLLIWKTMCIREDGLINKFKKKKKKNVHVMQCITITLFELEFELAA